jgi:antitoxin MazE
MRIETTVSKWGNSLAVRIPRSLAKDAQLAEGDSVAMDLDAKGRIVLSSPRKIYRLSDLVARISPKNLHRETDWGKPEGKEIW